MIFHDLLMPLLPCLAHRESLKIILSIVEMVWKDSCVTTHAPAERSMTLAATEYPFDYTPDPNQNFLERVALNQWWADGWLWTFTGRLRRRLYFLGRG